MYTSFFGLNDIPFSIAPNPDYLFLGDRHKEALAHLSYGLGDTGGFVLLTGEVGTGKTTLSRRLLEQLPENTQVAFILNPTLSCIELLATICDELKVRYKKTGITLKYLTDKIQQKLLKNQQEDINTLLIIDEAQHLQPEVLEQLRLLTNLETNTKKLLQVVLIGQPELQQLLQRRDLRQLAQRITARYHLLPLTLKEVELYIKHRLTVADCHRQLFKPSAIKLIHKISKGIPRLINLLCDRALATAYGNNDSVVTKKTVITASEQALGSEYHLIPWWQNKAVIGASVFVNLAIVIGAAYWLGSSQVSEEALSESEVLQPLKEQIQSNEQQGNSQQSNEQQSNTQKGNKSKYTQSNVVIGSDAENVAQTTELEVAKKVTEPVIEPSSDIVEPSSDIAKQNVDTESIDATQASQEGSVKTETPAAQSKEIAFDVSQIEGVSADLLAKVQQAVDDTGDSFGDEVSVEPEQAIPSLLDMPTHFQNKVPAMQFEVHIYATEGDGWIRVNGRERYEGDTVAGKVKLAKILQNKVVLELDGEQFTLQALSSW